MLSVHACPLAKLGGRDSGGMNVYVLQSALHLARRGVEVEIFTRATGSDLPPVAELVPGVLVRHVTAGPYEGLAKEDLPAQLCAFTSGVLRHEAMREPGHYDLVHSHYWLSGQVGWLAKERWGVPLVHSMHTMAKVKNAALAEGDTPEPAARILGEAQVVGVADRLVANTAEEAGQLVDLYSADPGQVAVAHPGVNLSLFRPGDAQAARHRVGLPTDAVVLLFVGRIQPLKAPDVLLAAAARMLAVDPSLRERLVVAVIGGPSGSGVGSGLEHLRHLAGRLGIADVVRFVPPVPQRLLADWYRAATVVVVPSYNESFGLVALEAQACGTPVVAASVGGLPTAVRDGVSGLLVDGHDPEGYARALSAVVGDVGLRRTLVRGAIEHAGRFGWSATAAAMVEVYAEVLDEHSAMTSGKEYRVAAGR